jgi:DNA invertase Pin-like site-specific DNA recombinase
VHRFERRLIGKRVKVALGVKRRRGELTGAAPYGKRGAPGPTRERHGHLRVIPVLAPDAAEQSVIESILALSSEGQSIRQIAASLAEQGVVGRAGRPLSRDAVHKVLVRSKSAA